MFQIIHGTKCLQRYGAGSKLVNYVFHLLSLRLSCEFMKTFQ